MKPTPKPAPVPLSPIDRRFWAKVPAAPLDACWHWQGSCDSRGYGTFVAGSRPDRITWVAHRYAYELLVGPVPAGLVLDHLCRVRHCVNPWHLEPVTNAENTRRGKSNVVRLRNTTCSRGHRYTPENTRYVPGTGRICRTCKRDTARAYRARKAQERGA